MLLAHFSLAVSSGGFLKPDTQNFKAFLPTLKQRFVIPGAQFVVVPNHLSVTIPQDL
jgi:hypothetical protein